MAKHHKVAFTIISNHFIPLLIFKQNKNNDKIKTMFHHHKPIILESSDPLETFFEPLAIHEPFMGQPLPPTRVTWETVSFASETQVACSWPRVRGSLAGDSTPTFGEIWVLVATFGFQTSGLQIRLILVNILNYLITLINKINNQFYHTYHLVFDIWCQRGECAIYVLFYNDGAYCWTPSPVKKRLPATIIQS